MLRKEPKENWSRAELEAARWIGQQKGKEAAGKATADLVTGNTKKAPASEAPLASDDPRNPQVIARAHFRQITGEELNELDTEALLLNETEGIVDLKTLGEERELQDSETQSLTATTEGDVGNITREAKQLLDLLDSQGDEAALPESMNEDMIRIAKENNIEVTEITTPDAVVGALRLKQQQQPSTPTESKPEFVEEPFTHPITNPASAEPAITIPVPLSVETSKPRFSAKSVEFDSAIDKALWVANAPKAGKEARSFLKQVLGWTDAEIDQARKDLNAHIAEAIELAGEKANVQGTMRVSALYSTNGNLVSTNSSEFNFFTEQTDEPTAPVVEEPAPKVEPVKPQEIKLPRPTGVTQNIEASIVKGEASINEKINQLNTLGVNVPNTILRNLTFPLGSELQKVAVTELDTLLERARVGEPRAPDVPAVVTPEEEPLQRTAAEYKPGDKLLYNDTEVVLIEILPDTEEVS